MHELSILVFADASRTSSHKQLGYIVGQLNGSLKPCSKFHIVAWFSDDLKRPVKSVPDTEILAASLVIDSGKKTAACYSGLLGLDIGVPLVVNSKDLVSRISTQRNYIDRSI